MKENELTPEMAEAAVDFLKLCKEEAPEFYNFIKLIAVTFRKNLEKYKKLGYDVKESLTEHINIEITDNEDGSANMNIIGKDALGNDLVEEIERAKNGTHV